MHGANAGYKSQGLLHPVGREHATSGMPGQAYAAAHGVRVCTTLVIDICNLICSVRIVLRNPKYFYDY